MTKPNSTQIPKGDPKASTSSSTKARLQFFSAKGLGSYHCFAPTEDKSRKLFRSAVLQYGSLAGLSNADQALASVLPKGFIADAATHGWALKEVMQEAQAFYLSQASAPRTKREGVDYDTRRLATILASLSPGGSPSALMMELKALIAGKADAALKHLERMEAEAGRDAEGFIYLRRVARPYPFRSGTDKIGFLS